MIKRLNLVLIVFLFFNSQVKGQVDRFNTTDLHPVSPTAFQFLKYVELPVSEYTGIPSISIPFYEVQVDEVKIPLQLTYYSQGIRVSQEASWVGLSWDLQVGSIVQTINDRDDYYQGGSIPMVKKLPDFFFTGDGSPRYLPNRYIGGSGSNSSNNGVGWVNPYPIIQPVAKQGFAIATNAYVPINGDFNIQQGDLFTSRYCDSEPDIFVANFLGHSVKFILDFEDNNKIVVLNQKGYVVTKVVNGFNIIVPSGSKFFFELKRTIRNSNTTQAGNGGALSDGNEAATNIFFLSKIVTNNGKEMSFGYSTMAEQVNYPNATQKLQRLTSHGSYTSSNSRDFANANIIDGDRYPVDNLFTITSYNVEQFTYLNSITFPGGRIDFELSDRSDIPGAKKLDSLKLINSNERVVRSWKLNYTYFDASSVGGNGYDAATLSSAPKSLLRLKLNNVQEINGGTYQFVYNSTLLPAKNSFARDYWGFYNGKLLNTSLIPNPVAFNHPEIGDNGNDKNADLNYVRAGMLEEIRYPTGGRVGLEYELNEFDKTEMPGFPSSTQIIQGDGLRIKTIKHFDNEGLIHTSKTVYTYNNGRLIHPIQLIRHVPYTVLNNILTNNTNLVLNNYTLTILSANSIFASDPLSSINGVGYDKVTVEQIDQSNNSAGKTVTEFYNEVDAFNYSIGNRLINSSIPSVKSISKPTNGTLKSILIYNNENVLLKRTDNEYRVSASNIYYGARIFGYGNSYFLLVPWPHELSFETHHVIAYYPIFDVTTKLSKSIQTDYFNSIDSVKLTISNQYDDLDRLTEVWRVKTDNSIHRTGYSYPHNDSMPVIKQMFNKNRIAELIEVSELNKSQTGTFVQISKKIKEFTSNGDKILESKITSNNYDGTGQISGSTISTYDRYDPIYSNLLQYTTENEITNALLWGNKGLYIVAEVKNALASEIAYTSFEDENTGNWNYDGLPINFIGKKGYSLNGSDITKSGLDATKIFIVSYFSSGNSAIVNGSSAIAGNTNNGRTYYEHVISGSSTITISGNVIIDELRLFPKGSLMTTYNYEPLIGMTSQTDAKGMVSYYEYDSLQRLKYIKDQHGNIIKANTYNYKP